MLLSHLLFPTDPGLRSATILTSRQVLPVAEVPGPATLCGSLGFPELGTRLSVRLGQDEAMELSHLRERAARGDPDAVAELIQLAGEQGDLDELRRLAGAGHRDAADELVQLAGERGDLDELRRLAAAGNRDAADVLAELTDTD